MVWKANDVWVQNMTACNFLGGSQDAGNYANPLYKKFTDNQLNNPYSGSYQGFSNLAGNQVTNLIKQYAEFGLKFPVGGFGFDTALAWAAAVVAQVVDRAELHGGGLARVGHAVGDDHQARHGGLRRHPAVAQGQALEVALGPGPGPGFAERGGEGAA